MTALMTPGRANSVQQEQMQEIRVQQMVIVRVVVYVEEQACMQHVQRATLVCFLAMMPQEEAASTRIIGHRFLVQRLDHVATARSTPTKRVMTEIPTEQIRVPRYVPRTRVVTDICTAEKKSVMRV